VDEEWEIWTVYVLRSLSNGWLYTRMTNDIDRRRREHNRVHTPNQIPVAKVLT
jgi:predicted GIY-YIG superfamily endonuclease